ncbi:MAG TPA: tetratricopeptide repeat protein [Candidatus Hydrothermia bacterium]|nr:tetratricopeptide repeat protein [Candidatus Hydrothermae bacterium]HRD22541.1 tetratricopeptide repeat protein [Candidatus Hydrothermia bacterium]
MKKWIGIVVILFGISMAQEPEPVDSAKIWFSIGVDYLNKNMYEDALRNFKRALKFNPNFIPAHLDMARAYLGIGTNYLSRGLADSSNIYIDSAEVVYRSISSIDSTDSRGWQGLGFIYSTIKNDPQKAVEFYNMALSLDPENVDAVYGLAKTYENLGEKEKADSVYKTAITKNPNSVSINYSYGLFLVELSRFDEAIPYLEKAYEIGIEDVDRLKEVLNAIVRASLQVGKTNKDYFNKAVHYSNILIELDSLNFVYYIDRGDAYAGLGRSNQALKDYDKSIELSGGNPAAYIKKAMYLTYDLKRYNDAISVLQNLLESENLSDYYRALGNFLLGDCYFNVGNANYQAAKARSNRDGAGDAVRYYERAKEAYNTALRYADASLRDQIARRLDLAESNRSKAFGVWKGIEPW